MAETKKPGYRDTLNMPETAFPMKADLARREPERLEQWKAAGGYAKLREALGLAAGEIGLHREGGLGHVEGVAVARLLGLRHDRLLTHPTHTP